MINCKGVNGILFMLAAGTCFAQPQTCVRLPPIDKPPVIDGKIETGEWAKGMADFGSVSGKTGFLTKRKVLFHLTYDEKNIYFAMQSELPPSPQTLSDTDTVEITLRPPGAEKPVAFRFNHNGAGNLPAGAKSANSFNAGGAYPVWEAEAEIPLAALGVAAIADGQEWGLQMQRNWKNADETGYWHLPGKTGETGVFIPDRTAPAVSFEGLGDKWYTPLSFGEFVYRAVNLTAAPQKVHCNAMLTSREVPIAYNASAVIAPGKSFVFQGRSLCLYPGTDRILTATLSNSENDLRYYERTLTFNLAKGLGWIDPDPPLVLDIGVYPSFKKAKARISGNAAKLAACSQVVFRIKNGQGKVFCEEKAEKRGSNNFFKMWTLPGLPLGGYVISAEAIDKAGKKTTFEKSFAVREFEWQNNTIGTDRIIIPPFKPLVVDQAKREIHALQTGYRINGAFWDAVYAQGKNILAAPVECTIDGGKFSPLATRLISAEPDKVVYESDVEYKTLKLTVVHEYDYDGLCKTTLKFKPSAKIEIKELYLDIPLKKEYAKLFYPCAGIRDMSIGALPEGSGVVWEGSMKPVSSYLGWSGNWRPWFWFGEIYKGICWFAEDQNNWHVDRKRSVQKFIRTGDAAILRIELINRPSQLEAPFDIVMGFQPTPVKPRPEGFRKLAGTMWSTWTPVNADVSALTGHNMGLYAGTHGTFAPMGGDYSFIDYCFARSWKTRDELMDVIYAYLKKNKIDDNNWCKYAKDKVPLSERMRQGAIKVKQAKYVALYNNPRQFAPEMPEWDMYIDEWHYRSWRPAPFFDEYVEQPIKNMQDMLLYNCKKELRAGFDGIYYDNLMPMPCGDTISSTAMEINPESTAMDSVRWSYPIFCTRELIRRTAVLAYQENKMICGRPFVWLHTTGCPFSPWLSFAAMQYTWEMNSHKGDYQDRFPEAYMHAETLGTQSGLIPRVMVNTSGKNPEHTARTMLAVLFAQDVLLFDDTGTKMFDFWKNAINLVRGFGYGDPGVDVFPGWDLENPVKVVGAKDVRVTTVRRPDGKTLLLVGNLGDKVSATFDLSQLGYKNCVVRNAETGREVSAGQKVTTDLPEHEYALLLVEAVN